MPPMSHFAAADVEERVGRLSVEYVDDATGGRGGQQLVLRVPQRPSRRLGFESDPPRSGISAATGLSRPVKTSPGR